MIETKTMIEKRKILILYYSSHTVCGIGSNMKMISKMLSSFEWDVNFGIAWGRKFNNPKNIEHITKGYKTYLMDGRTGTEEGRIQAIIRIIKKAKPDVVLLNNLISTFEAVRRLKRTKKSFYLVAINSGTLPKQTLCLIENMDVIDKIVCVNKTTYKVMRSFYGRSFEKSSVYFIPNGVPERQCDHRKSNGVFRIGYAGRLDKNKRVMDIFLFWDKIKEVNKNIELWIAGSGDAEEEFKRLGEKENNVRFFSGLTREDLYKKFYPNLDIFVHFSGAEGFGLSICEAMMNGCAIIASTFKGINGVNHLLPDVNCLTFPVGNIDQAIKQTLKLIDDPELMKKISKKGEEHVAANFSEKIIGAKWNGFLTSCVNNSTHYTLNNENEKKINVEKYKEYIRYLLRYRFPHKTAREEWPHYELWKTKNKGLIEEVHRLFSQYDSNL